VWVLVGGYECKGNQRIALPNQGSPCGARNICPLLKNRIGAAAGGANKWIDYSYIHNMSPD